MLFTIIETEAGYTDLRTSRISKFEVEATCLKEAVQKHIASISDEQMQDDFNKAEKSAWAKFEYFDITLNETDNLAFYNDGDSYSVIAFLK